MPPKQDQVPGGLSAPIVITKRKPLSVLNPTLYKILKQLKWTIADRYTQAKCPTADKNALDFWPILFRTQIVSGINYYVKLKVVHHGMAPVPGAIEYIHVVIYEQSWTNTLQLTDLQTGKTREDILG
ncbi:hypothetical protein BGZ93_007092 [Podila epicladia]|nr:hypothetical protein BGZ92_002589 [Podila epicladia]KAG0094547.1 hypothetical protein BGZ93_007092 [Podila epicladia]